MKDNVKPGRPICMSDAAVVMMGSLFFLKFDVNFSLFNEIRQQVNDTCLPDPLKCKFMTFLIKQDSADGYCRNFS
jgi:hypothetical protein